MNSDVVRSDQRLLVSLLAALSMICWLPTARALAPSPDSVTVASVTASSSFVDVPVYIRDLSSTPLGADQPPGSKIQSYSIKVNYAPASSISSISFVRAGVTQTLTPAAEFTPSSAGSISLVDTFQESTNPIPFTLNAAAPGNQVAKLVVVLSPSAAPGSTITLTLDPVLTVVSNQDGTLNETTGAASLALVSGAIAIPSNFVSNVPTLSTWGLALLAIALAAVVVLRMR